MEDKQEIIECSESKIKNQNYNESSNNNIEDEYIKKDDFMKEVKNINDNFNNKINKLENIIINRLNINNNNNNPNHIPNNNNKNYNYNPYLIKFYQPII